MPKRKPNGRGDHVRLQLAHEAARLIAEHGIEDYRLAKRKAAQQLGVSNRNCLPKNSEIHAALAEYQHLFDGEAHDNRLMSLRRIARDAMLMFSDFEPRLVGSVLAGTSTRHSDVNLHLFADSPEAVAMIPISSDIPYRSAERRARYFDDRLVRYPVFQFAAGSTTVDAMVFPANGIRLPPACPVDGHPIKRANLKAVERLLGETSS